MTLLFEKDFDTISIKEITEFAQIGRKTFYLHYIDKYDLLDQIVSEKLIELEQISEAKKSLGIQEGTQLWFEFFENNRTFFMKILISTTLQIIRKSCFILLKKNLRKSSDTCCYWKGLDYDLYINFISNGIVGLLDIYLNSSENTEEQEK